MPVLGERTPVGVRMADPPASISQHWKMCKEGRLFRAAVAGMQYADPLEETLTVRRVLEREDGTSHEGEWYVFINSAFICTFFI